MEFVSPNVVDKDQNFAGISAPMRSNARMFVENPRYISVRCCVLPNERQMSKLLDEMTKFRSPKKCSQMCVRTWCLRYTTEEYARSLNSVRPLSSVCDNDEMMFYQRQQC